MKKPYHAALWLVLLMTVSACVFDLPAYNTITRQNHTKKTTTPETDIIAAGTYFANLPLPAGKDTLVNIVFNADKTYSASIEYDNDAEHSAIYNDGSWSQKQQMITLKPSHIEGENVKITPPALVNFHYDGKVLTLLDSSGKAYTKKRDRYRFEKK